LNRTTIKRQISIGLGILLLSAFYFASPAQSNSVVTVNSDNVLVINGRKVFPIGFSPIPPINGKTPTADDALQEFRNAGALLFRMVQNNNWSPQVIADQQAALDWAAQHGMYVWLNLRELSQFPSTDTNTPVQLASIVDTFKNHPSLGLWKNFDEAWWGGVSVTNLKNGYDVIKLHDTNHPVVQTHAPRGYVTNLQPYNVAADVLAVDIYPVAVPAPTNPPPTNTNISVVGDWANEIAQVAGGQKEFWLIEQIASSGTTPPGKTLIFPTFTQSRYMAYQSIIDGARGLMFFGGNIAATLTNTTDAALSWNWTFWTNVLKQVVQQLGDHSVMAPALVVSNSTLPITITGTGSPDLEFCVREAPPYLYVLAGKREGNITNVTFNGLPSWATSGEVLYESPRTVMASAGHFTDTFAPFDVHVYRFSQTNVPVSILFPPQNRTNNTGAVATFTVFADGTGPLMYHWRKNGTNVSDDGNISGSSSSTLTIGNVAQTNAGTYDVVVSGIGSITSAPALFVVTNPPPTIVTAPQSKTNSASSTTSFLVSAIGPGTLTYQWRKNGSNLSDGGIVSGASSTALTLSNLAVTDAGNYDVVVTGFGSTTSIPPAVLTVLETSLLLYEPFDYTNIGGQVSSNTPANWGLNGGSPNDLNVTAGNLTYAPLADSIGNSVTNGGQGFGVRRIASGSVSNGLVYFSALFRINDLGYGVWSGTAAQAGALAATDNQLFLLQVMVKSNSPAGYVFGVQKGGTGASSTFDTTEFHTGDTVFLVGKYDFTLSPEAVSLWVNPASTNFGATGAPPATVMANTGTNRFAIDRFNMRQNTANSVPAAMQWDELRLGTTWAAVTPPRVPRLANFLHLANGTLQFSFTNTTALNYNVYASTNLFDWTSLGPATQTSPGIFQFTDTAAINFQRRFYQLRSQ
jgi:hypothetical protein